jgi:hypothetical protein
MGGGTVEAPPGKVVEARVLWILDIDDLGFGSELLGGGVAIHPDVFIYR